MSRITASGFRLRRWPALFALAGSFARRVEYRVFEVIVLIRIRLFTVSMLIVIFSISLLLPILSAQAASSSSKSADANVNRNDLPLVSLKGDWQFYWQQALTPDDFNETAIASANQPKGATINIPSSWVGQTLGTSINNGKPLPRFGYATYRKQMTIPAEQVGTNMALLLESVGSAYRIWVNGELVDGLGKVAMGSSATGSESETPWIRLNLIYFTTQTEQLDIVIQTSNYSFRESGIFGDTKIGDANALTLYVFKNYILQDLLFIGAFLVIGLYHLIIYFISKRTVDLLWLGALCLFFAIRALLLNKFLFYSVLPDVSWSLLLNMQFAFKFIAFLTYLGLIRSLYRDDVNPLLHRIFNVIGLLMLLYVLVVPLSHFTVTILAQTIVIVITIIYYGGFVGYSALGNRREGASLNMVGTFVFIIGIVHDYFLFTTNLSSVQMIPFALLMYLLLQAATISYRYAMIQRRNLQLAGELQEMNSSLEATVAERTEKLQESNEQLYQIAEQRAQLMANIAHDMGSPLVGIQSHLNMMREEEATRDQRKFVVFDQMVTKLTYLKKMTDNLFDLSQLEAGAMDLQLEREKVADVSQNLQAEVRRIADAASMEVSFGRWFPTEHNRPEDEVLVDFHSLCRVVQNYMENAHKFSTSTPCRLVVHGDVGTVESGLRELVFTVEDFGSGIAEEDLPHIFERFYKGKGQVKGGGLGLAIVKEIMDQHGGTVGVTSQFGRGSTFFFRLPVR